MTTNSIKDLSKLSLNTAITLFRLKVAPTITYGPEIIWESLKKKNLEDIEKVKASFLKRALSLSKYTPSRLTRIDIIAYSQITKKGYIIDPTMRIETGNSQPEDVNKEKINIYLPTVDYFKAKYQLEDIEVIGLLIGTRGVIPKFFESFRKTFELPQTLTADIISSVLKRSCQILSHHIHSV
ncbi:hypothetical protein ANN_01796 [Periplaneta americana]|uniref:Uncharacterized protein n=1 Tax=Periplaneta americana TaxID=6978 RepID=A0ABQ8TYM8_PERAM|nr:hypothetical protein ANN_01796 [Periplaneta americana]